MEINLEKKDSTYGAINIKVEEADYLSDFNKKLREMGKQMNLKGFRPGKVPLGLVKRMYGKQVKAEVLQEKMDKSLQEYMDKEEILSPFHPLLASEEMTPEELDAAKEVSFDFEILISPEINIALDESFKVQGYEIEVSDNDVDKTIERIREESKKMNEVDEIAKGDFIKATFKLVDGEFSKETLLPLNQVAEKEQDSFIGLKIEESLKFDTREAFPEDDTLRLLFGIEEEEAQALTGEMEMTIESISRETLPEMDEEFFKAALGPETPATDEASFREEVKKVVAQANDPHLTSLNRLKLKEAIMDRLDIELSEEILKKYLAHNLKDEAPQKETTEEPAAPVTEENESEAKEKEDTTPESEEKEPTLTKEERVEKEFPNFKESAKWQVVQDKLMREHNIEVSQEEIYQAGSQEVYNMFSQMGYPIGQEQLQDFTQNYLSNNNGEQYAKIRNSLLYEKSLGAVMDKVTYEKETVDVERFNEVVKETNERMEKKDS